jgi:methionine synthase II (cobalamin-independent)
MNRVFQTIAVLLLLILLAVTNPALEKHQEAISAAFAREHKVAGALGVGFVYSTLFRYRDYVFFSLTRFEGEVRSIGVLGFVYAF